MRIRKEFWRVITKIAIPVLRIRKIRLLVEGWLISRSEANQSGVLKEGGFFKALRKAHRRRVRHLKNPEIRVYERDGLKFRHDIRHVAQWHHYISGTYQTGVLYWMSRYASTRGGSVIDVGANVGVFTLPLAAKMSWGQHVVAFEPNPDTAKALREAIVRNGCEEKVHVVELGLSRVDGTAMLSFPSENAGEATIREVETFRNQKSFQIPIRRFDSWLSEHSNFRDVSVVKLDVEGAEEDVLRGMEGEVDKQRFPIILEISPQWVGIAGILSYFKARQYSCYEITDEPPFINHIFFPLHKQINMLAVPAEIDDLRTRCQASEQGV